MMENLFKNWLLVSKIIWGIWITSEKQRKVQTVETQWDTFVFKHYIQRIYQTLPSTNYKKSHQIPFHDTTRLHYFNSNITYLWQKYYIKVQIFRFLTAGIKIRQISPVIFQTKSESFFKAWITHQCHER